MSLTITTDVFCDADDCQQWEHGVTGARVRGVDARRAVKACGWSHVDGKDYCPDHTHQPEETVIPAHGDECPRCAFPMSDHDGPGDCPTILHRHARQQEQP